MTIHDRARAYIARMPPAITGSGGHAATFNVALVLVKGFALEEAAALDLLAEWNTTQAKPPWRESELRSKVRSAAQSTRTDGYLLHEAAPSWKPCSSMAESEAERKARQRRSWPAFAPLTASDIQAIAVLRKQPVEAVDLFAKSGFIGSAVVSGHQCYAIGERYFVQTRRMDGQPITRHDGTTIKAMNLPGSKGAFIGLKWLGNDNPILLVEGAIGLMEATAAILMTGRTDWTCLAATSASSRFARDTELLARLRGRRVRIVPDADECGLDAAAIWLVELEDAGAMVDAIALPDGCKDLGDIVALQECHGEFLNTLFL
ncbi:MAG: hypothetical protein ACOYMN_05250 [Roseimicrobium sp.]